jgi:CRISPR/Cas system-associated exonuclease Cas4 (RecB family)
VSDHPIIPIHSVTALQTFEQCPRKYYAMYVSRVPSKQSDEMAWGNTVHKALENRLKRGMNLPPEMAAFAWAVEPFVKLKAQGFVVHAEQNMAITKKLEAVDYWAKDGTVWLRGKTDADAQIGDAMLITDYKTGKVKEDKTQLRMMAMLVFARNEAINTVKAMFAFLKFSKTSTPVTYTRDKDYNEILHDIWPRIDAIEHEFRINKFHPNPGPLCGWCHIKQCEYWDDRDGQNK